MMDKLIILCLLGLLMITAYGAAGKMVYTDLDILEELENFDVPEDGDDYDCDTKLFDLPSFTSRSSGKNLVNVDTFGAAGDGVSDDTQGSIIERIQESLAKEGKKKKMIYLGDGAGDYCPSLKLKTEDYVMPRKNFPVWDLISQNPMLIKAAIREWTDGESLEMVLMGIIEEIRLEEEKEKNMLTSAENKVEDVEKVEKGKENPSTGPPGQINQLIFIN